MGHPDEVQILDSVGIKSKNQVQHIFNNVTN